MADPKVSVIIATYNRANYLSKAISSVIAQTYPAWELIIWNDGSTDDTEETISSFNDARIRHFYEKNHGKCYALNRAVELAKGEWIAILDDDDLWHQEKLELQMNLILRHPDIDVLFSNFNNENLVSGERNEGFQQNRKILQAWKTKQLEPNSFIVIGDFMPTSLLILPSSTIIKKDSLIDVGPFNEQLRNGEDLELWFRFFLRGHKFAFIDKVLVDRIKPEGSLSSPSVASYENHQAALTSCCLYAKQSQRDDLLPLFRKPFRSSWQGLIRQYAFMGQRKKAISAFIKSCHYGMNIRSIYLLVEAMVGPKIISKWRRQ